MADRPQDIDVFISYKREERALADRVSAALTGRGYTVVTDLNISTGATFGDAIEQMIVDAKLVIVLWTEAAAASPWVRAEAERAFGLGKYLGVMVTPGSLPLILQPVNYLDLSADGLTDANLAILTADATQKLGPPQRGSIDAEAQTTALNDDFVVFQSVERMGHEEGYEAYLREFPNGRFAPVARKKLRELRGWRRVFRILSPASTFLTAVATVALALLTYWGITKDPPNVAEVRTELQAEIDRLKPFERQANNLAGLPDRVRALEPDSKVQLQ